MKTKFCQKEFGIACSVVLANLIFIGLAIIFYNGQFLFWQYPLSTAGTSVSESGQLNLISMIFFSLSMLVSSILMFRLSKIYAQQKNIIAKNLSYISSLGFFLVAIFQDNTNHFLHLAGVFVALASLWLIIFLQLFNDKNKFNPKNFYLLEFVLNFPLLVYALVYLLHASPIAYNLQKLAISSICLVWLVISRRDKFYDQKKIG